VGAAVIVSQKLPAGIGDVMAMMAKESFMDGWQVMVFVACGISIIGAIFVLKFMPARHEPAYQAKHEMTLQPDKKQA